MTRGSIVASLLTSLLVFVIVSPRGHAGPSDVGAPLPEAVSVVLRTVRTAARGASLEDASAGPTLHVGDEGTAWATTGGFDPQGLPTRALCADGIGAGPLAPKMSSYAVKAWTVRSRLLDATMESVRLEVDWSRQEARTAGDLKRAAGDVRTLVLREGESHTLDFVTAPEGDLACGRSVRVDILAKVEEDPRFAAALLDYDLWLIDEAPDRPTHQPHLALQGRQGESVEFEFDPLAWPLEGILLRGGAEGRVEARVTGTLRGRLRDDGTVEMLLDAHRRIGIGSGEASSDGIGDGGRKVLRLRDGETVGLTLPPAQGVHARALDGTWSSVSGAPGMTPSPNAAAPEAVELTKERVSVDFGRFFSGHRMSLRLTARRHAT